MARVETEEIPWVSIFPEYALRTSTRSSDTEHATIERSPRSNPAVGLSDLRSNSGVRGEEFHGIGMRRTFCAVCITTRTTRTTRLCKGRCLHTHICHLNFVTTDVLTKRIVWLLIIRLTYSTVDRYADKCYYARARG